MPKPSYTVKDLRYPVVFLRADQVPSETDETWKLHVKPYYEGFAFVSEPKQRRTKGKDDDSKALYFFAVRYDPTIRIEYGDVISWEDTLYYIRDHKRVRGLHEFMEIDASMQQRADSALYEEDDTVVSPPVVNGATLQTPFWEEDADYGTK